MSWHFSRGLVEDYLQVDYLRKVLNAWHEHLNSPWLSADERKERIYKLKKGRK